MMAVTPDKVQIGTSSDYLDGVAVDTAAGTGLFRETVVLADPEAGGGLANVRQLSTQLVDTDKGVVTNTVIHGLTTGGGGSYRDVKVNPSGALTVDTGLAQPTTPADTQPVSAASLPLPTGAATEAKQLPDNHQVSVSNFPATQAVSGTVELGATSLAALESVSVQNTVTVQATDLDIRNLSSAQDSVNVGNFPATQAVSGTVTANLGTLNGASTSAKQLPDNHNVTVSNFPSSPSSGTNSSVAGSTSQVTLLAANASRKGATIYNDSTLNALKISLGATVTGTSFTAVIASTGYYEVPFGYTGIITGVFNTATGAARITELT